MDDIIDRVFSELAMHIRLEQFIYHAMHVPGGWYLYSLCMSDTVCLIVCKLSSYDSRIGFCIMYGMHMTWEWYFVNDYHSLSEWCSLSHCLTFQRNWCACYYRMIMCLDFFSQERESDVLLMHVIDYLSDSVCLIMWLSIKISISIV